MGCVPSGGNRRDGRSSSGKTGAEEEELERKFAPTLAPLPEKRPVTDPKTIEFLNNAIKDLGDPPQQQVPPLARDLGLQLVAAPLVEQGRGHTQGVQSVVTRKR